MNLDSVISEEQFDFIDFGCSKGESIKWIMETFAGRNGLGVDIDPRKVEIARASGLKVIQGDVTNLACSDDAVSFVTMVHFLEHLRDLFLARECIMSAYRFARDFVFIRHPWFGSDAELFTLGYKFYWSDWKGHPNHMGPHDLYKVIRDIQPRPHVWYVFGRNRISDVKNSAVVPLNRPNDRHALSPEELADRPADLLGGPAFRELACLIVKTPQSRDPVSQLLHDHILIGSSADIPSISS